MHKRRVFIIGQSLFAETLMHLLTAAATDVSVAGLAPLVADAIPVLRDTATDVIILVSTSAAPIGEEAGKLLAVVPNVSIIFTNLDENTVQVITSKRVDARLSELLAVLAMLPEIPQKLSNGGNSL